MSEQEQRASVSCVECGKTEEAHYARPYGEEMVRRSLCFICLLWTRFAESDPTDPRSLVIEGGHYRIGDEQQRGSRDWRGFGGRRFRIRRADGTLVESTNLWFQGTIPERFRGRLPDNAAWESES